MFLCQYIYTHIHRQIQMPIHTQKNYIYINLTCGQTLRYVFQENHPKFLFFFVGEKEKEKEKEKEREREKERQREKEREREKKRGREKKEREKERRRRRKKRKKKEKNKIFGKSWRGGKGERGRHRRGGG